jgi:hypothetical protein
LSTDPVDFLLRAAMRLPRPAIERLADGLIDRLDDLDGDPDLEEDDPDTGVDDEGEDAASEALCLPGAADSEDQRLACLGIYAYDVDRECVSRP